MKIDIKKIKESTKESLKGKIKHSIWIYILKLSALAICYSMIRSLWIFGPIISFFIYFPVTVALKSYYLHIVKNYNLEFFSFFKYFSRCKEYTKFGLIKFWRLFKSFLLIIPFVPKIYSYKMSYFILADWYNTSPKEALFKSSFLMKGRRSELFKLELQYFPSFILSFLTLGVFWPIHVLYIETARAEYYEKLKRITNWHNYHYIERK